MVPNLHTVAMSVGVLCVRCKSCGHRGAVDKQQLPGRYGSMTQLRDLRFWCQQCKALVHGKNDLQSAVQYWEKLVETNPNYPEINIVKEQIRIVKEQLNQK